MPRVLSKAALREIGKEALAPREIIDVSLTPPYTVWDYHFVNDNKAVTFVCDGVTTTYTPLGFSRGPYQSESDESVDRISIALDDTNRVWANIVQGVLIQGSRIRLRKLFKGLQTNEQDGLRIFDGFLGAPTFDDQTFSIEIRSIVAYIETELPPRTFQSGCNYFLGSTGCGVDMSTPQNTRTFIAGAGSTKYRVRAPELNGYQFRHWESGYVRVLSGSEKGSVRPIGSSVIGQVNLMVPFHHTVEGREVSVVRGCRKTKNDCVSRYDNINNYGGFSEIPTTPIIDE